MRITFPALLLLILLSTCTEKQNTFVSHADDAITYTGRTDHHDQGVDLYWSASSIRAMFDGTSIGITMKDETGDNYYNVIIDGKIELFRPDTTRSVFWITDLTKGMHSLEIFKRTEWNRGKSTFYGFELPPDAEITKASPRPRTIEFFGNSITAGYAVEDTSGKDSPDSTYTNNYLSYAAITARHFDASYHCTCKSGIGITISWFPLIMPEIYDRLDPENPESSWDFDRFTPEVVVVNLFQNDSWLVNMPERAEFKANFGDKPPTIEELVTAYENILMAIRSRYPEAHIISALGNMDATREDSPWPGYITQAVGRLDDDKIHTHFFPFKNSPGHPSIKEQELMAESLIQFLEQEISW